MSYSSSPASFTSTRWITHPSLHLRDAHDAHVLLEAVRLNILPLIKRRLVTGEREQLQSGNVFVWEEADDSDEGGLKRWTDGRRWSQSRMRGDYLFYEEKVETTQEEKDAKAARRARRASDPKAILPPPARRKDRPSKLNGLTKQTYSAVIQQPGEHGHRKWHVVAYFHGNDYTRLPVIENFDYLRRIRIPEGVYLSNKAYLPAADEYPIHPPLDSPLSPQAPSPSYDIGHRPSTPSSPASSVSTASSSTSPLLLSRPVHPVRPFADMPVLPPLSSISHSLSTRPGLPRRCTMPHPVSKKYASLTSEDRKVLDRLRVAL